ncbi:MAG TPA: hypothetical protein VIX14_06170 [Terriglobales bacterium]
MQSTFLELKDTKTTSKEEPIQLLRVEHTVVTRADRELAWKVFCNVGLWPRFSDLYGDIRWLGEPWMPGSHMNIELKSPVGAVVDHVITVCNPPRLVAWIDHARGDTMEQWVHFKCVPSGGTELHTWAELVGTTTTIEGRDVREVATDFIRTWYNRFSAECHQLASGDAP